MTPCKPLTGLYADWANDPGGWEPIELPHRNPPTFNFRHYRFKVNGVVYLEETTEFLKAVERLQIISALRG